MYLILNHSLNFKKDKYENNYYEISVPKDMDILCDSYDYIELSQKLKYNYKLGEKIYLYCISDSKFEIESKDSENIRIYKFKVKSEVPFKVLKESSKALNDNTFMIYKLCSDINNLITQDNWDKCLDGLLDTSNFNTLSTVYKYLNNMPKSNTDKLLLNDTLDKIRNVALIKSFYTQISNMYELLLYSSDISDCNELMISRFKLHIFSEKESIDEILNDIDNLISWNYINMLDLLISCYIDKLTLIFINADTNKKHLIKKTEQVLEKCINFLETNDKDCINARNKVNTLLKQHKRMF